MCLYSALQIALKIPLPNKMGLHMYHHTEIYKYKVKIKFVSLFTSYLPSRQRATTGRFPSSNALMSVVSLCAE